MTPFLEQLQPFVGLRLDEAPHASLIRYQRRRRVEDGEQTQQTLAAAAVAAAPRRNIARICENAGGDAKQTDANEQHTFFIDPMTRGYSASDLLNKYLGLTPDDFHPLPWDVPRCALDVPLDRVPILSKVRSALQARRRKFARARYFAAQIATASSRYAKFAERRRRAYARACRAFGRSRHSTFCTGRFRPKSAITSALCTCDGDDDFCASSKTFTFFVVVCRISVPLGSSMSSQFSIFARPARFVRRSRVLRRAFFLSATIRSLPLSTWTQRFINLRSSCVEQ